MNPAGRMWENCKAQVEMDDSASCLRLAAMESCKLRRIRPQICVGNPVRNGWFEVTHESTRSPGSGPSFSQENRLKSVPFESDSTYILWYGTSLGESVTYDSETRRWR